MKISFVLKKEPAAPTYEDFTTYSKTDSGSSITLTENNVNGDGSMSSPGYAYKDFGAGHFSGDLSFNFDYRRNTGLDTLMDIGCLVLTNNNGVFQQSTNTDYIAAGNDDHPDADFALWHKTTGTANKEDTSSLFSAYDTWYYFTLVKSVGDNKVYLYGYSDSDRTSLIDTLEITLDANDSYQYLQPLSWNSSMGGTINVDVANLEIN